MIEHQLDIQTPDGRMNTFITHPEEDGPHPVVIFYMDAPGKREELHDMARRLGTVGYYVILPNLYYRETREFELDFTGKDPARSRERMRELMYGLGNNMVMRDTQALLDFVDAQDEADSKRIGCVGYCMSGPFAFTAAGTYPDRIAAAASIYGVRLYGDHKDSPPPKEMIDQLDHHLQQSGARYRIEWYPGTHHGFAFPQRPAYDKHAGERHWERLFALFQRNLALVYPAMHFELSEEHRMLQDLVAKFVDQQLIPLEPAVLKREASGQPCSLTADEATSLNTICREAGLWGLDAPEACGGANLPALALIGVNEEVGRSATPFHFPPDSPNLHMLMATANDAQKRKYLDPYARGETVSAIAISEPGAGADPASMKTRAKKEGNEWILNGRKIWVSKMDHADFSIVMAVTDPDKGRNGISAFLVDKDTPGFIVEREIPMIGGLRTFEIVIDNCRIPAGQLLGEEGKGFAPMQLRLSVRRLQMGAWCIGMARRAVEMMVEHANQRVTFGQPLADRQTVQWWIADAETKIHACRLMCQQAAWKLDQGQDVRTEISMVKVYGTEMAQEIIDNAMQCFGAMGMTKELPLHLMASKVRAMRIYDGPSEVHRWVIARRRLG